MMMRDAPLANAIAARGEGTKHINDRDRTSRVFCTIEQTADCNQHGVANA